MTSIWGTVVEVDVTNYAQCTWWTATDKLFHHIVTSSTILTRVWLTVVNVEFTILTLESIWADALVVANFVLTGASILTRSRFAFVYFSLTVRIGVALVTMTSVRVSDIFARAIMTQLTQLNILANGCIFAGDHFHVAELSSPSGSTHALVDIGVLLTGGTVIAWLLRAPFNVLATIFPSESV